MVFWAGILVGGVFAWLAVRRGFYETWTMLFNIVISVYVAVFLTPVVLDVIPAAGQISYGKALTLAATAIGTFLILCGISYTLLTGQFTVPFPRIFDVLFAGLLGFLGGFLVLSFTAFVLLATPLSQNTMLKEMGLSRQSQQSNISYVCWWGDLVHGVASSANSDYTTEDAVNRLLPSTENKTPDQAARDGSDT
jgi:uncharacterized membrane protein required for colicin V production